MLKPKRMFLIISTLFISIPTLSLISCSNSSPRSTAATTDMYQQLYPKATALYNQMTFDEKIGQLVLPSYVLLANSVSANGMDCKNAIQYGSPEDIIIQACGLDQIQTYHIGAVLTGGGPYFDTPTLANWAQLNQRAKTQHNLGSPLDPVLLTGNDAIHINMHVQGGVMGPHEIGLGVTHDPNLVAQIGELTGQDSLASGFNWIYMPTLAVAHDSRWGRAYESFSNNPLWVKLLGHVFIAGVQNIKNNQITGALATAKHFLGDGDTQYGLDEGDDAFTGSEQEFWLRNGIGYEGALQAKVGSIMVSYTAIDGDDTRMHFGGKWNINNQFKTSGITGSDGNNYQFTGFMVGDWNGPTRAAYFYNKLNDTQLSLPETMAKAINGGVDMLMLGQGDTVDPFDPNSAPTFTSVGQVIEALKSAYNSGLINDARLQDAVVRILAVKLAMQQAPIPDYATIQSQERAIALKAAKESLVLLKNANNLLPVNKSSIQNVVFIGDTDDLGLQNGGWTINWQGQKGDVYFSSLRDSSSSGAATIQAAIKALLPTNINYYYVNDTQNDLQNNPALNSNNTIAISVVSEVPYAEYMGDIANGIITDAWYQFGATYGYNLYLGLPQSNFLGLHFDNAEATAISRLNNQGIPVVSIAYSGRPLIVTDGGNTAPLTNSTAFIVAFLPGTTGGTAISAAIFGDYGFCSGNTYLGETSNTLTFPWPRNMNDIASHFATGSLYPVGYGLCTKSNT